MNNIIPAVDKTIQLLQVLAGRDATQSELSRELGITMSSAYRILMTLQHHNWVRKKSGASYALSEGILPLLHGVAEDMSVLERACRQVADIAENRNMACKLSIRRGGEQLTYFRAEPPGPVSLTGQSGSTFPLIESRKKWKKPLRNVRRIYRKNRIRNCSGRESVKSRNTAVC